jgi:replicative DNA helicase
MRTGCGWTAHRSGGSGDARDLGAARLDIWIDDSSVVTIAQLQAKLRRMAQQLGGVDLVLIDYLQLMQGGGRHRDNRVQEVSEISRGLKMLARDLDVPIIAAAQLSRAPEMRQPHIPMLSDLRESGASSRTRTS